MTAENCSFLRDAPLCARALTCDCHRRTLCHYRFSLLLLSMGLFILGSNIAVAFLENNITFCQTLRSMSILMYFFYMYVIAFMGLCLKKGWIMWNVYEVWGVVWLITILFAFFVCYYMQTESGKWIKRII